MIKNGFINALCASKTEYRGQCYIFGENNENSMRPRVSSYKDENRNSNACARIDLRDRERNSQSSLVIEVGRDASGTCEKILNIRR